MTASTTTARGGRPVVSARARELAARLSAMFLEDQALATRQADSQRRLHDANDRLWSGLAPDALGVIYDRAAPVGHSEIAYLTGAGPASHTRLLGALQETHWQVHHAFCAYQSACEERRGHAAEVGETIREFLDALIAAGWTEKDARTANVHQLATTTGDGETGR